jgi:hypothetical protein
MITVAIYWSISLACFEKINSHFENKTIKLGEDFEYLGFIKKLYILFGGTTISSLVASTIIYPLDTFKRHIQVNESLGFNSEYSSGNMLHSFKKFLKGGNIYRGFTVNFLKIIPYSWLHYTIFMSFQS